MILLVNGGSRDPAHTQRGRFVSIFQRVCPQCATTNSVSSLHCGCGYNFDGSPTTSHDQAAQDEQLYLDYLAARVAQAAEALDFARAAAHREPESHALAAEVIAAEQSLRTARAEHAEQAARTRTARQQAIANASFQRPAPVVARPTRPEPVTPSPTAAPSPAPRPEVMSAASTPIQAKLNSVQKPKSLPRQTAATLAAKAKALKPKHRATAPAFSRPTVGQNAPAPRPTPAAPRVQPSAIPPAPFRAKQAARAEKVVERQRGTPIVTPKAPLAAACAPGPAAIVAPTKPKSVAAPGIRAAAPLPTTPTKPCPSCGNRLAVDAKRCGCGYEISDGPDLPGLSASPAAVAVNVETPGRNCPHCGGTVASSLAQCRCGYEFSDGPDIPGLPLSEADPVFLFDFGLAKPT